MKPSNHTQHALSCTYTTRTTSIIGDGCNPAPNRNAALESPEM